MNNSVFGKTQENLWKRVVYIITDAATLHKRVAKPSFYCGMAITEDLAVIQCKVQTTLNRPVGFTVLELSKLHTYDFHYNHIKARYPHANQLKLLFTGTDSRTYSVQTDNIYTDMADDTTTRYDFSEYPLDHPLYNTSNHKALAFFKDELNSVGLRPKCYAFMCTGKVDKNIMQHANTVEQKTAKGVKRKVKEEHLHFSHYLDAYNNFHSLV